MKTLVIGDITSVFTFEFITEILFKSDLNVDILCFKKEKEIPDEYLRKLETHGCRVYTEERIPNTIFGKNVALVIRRLVSYRRCKYYDKIILLSISWIEFVIPMFAKKCSRIVSVFYGTDILRLKPIRYWYVKALLDRTNVITVENENVKQVLLQKLGRKYDEKLHIAHLGTTNAEKMTAFFNDVSKEEGKRFVGAPLDKILIYIGYNANPAQRHLEIIRSLSVIRKDIRERLYVVCQCSYGGTDAYIHEIEKELKKSHVPGHVLTMYCVNKELALIRKSADIMLNLQPTDSISASMLECMEGGAIIVKGDWLVYPELVEKATYMHSISEMNEVTEKIENIVDNWEQEIMNTHVNEGILGILSWEKGRENWNKILGI